MVRSLSGRNRRTRGSRQHPSEHKDSTASGGASVRLNGLEGKVALITGAARGQGRSHARRLAESGADIIAIDVCGGSDSFPWLSYPLATPGDLSETVRLVEETGQQIHAHQADVRDLDSLRVIVKDAVERFGRLDIVCANAGICAFGPESWLTDDGQWSAVYEVNLLGVRNTCKAAAPAMIELGHGGSIVITSSGAGLRGCYGLSDYCATKWGVIGFAESLAHELGAHRIRVNVVAPGTVDTDMIQNEGLWRWFCPDIEAPTAADAAAVSQLSMMLPIRGSKQSTSLMPSPSFAPMRHGL